MVASIHQPNSQITDCFDDLLLLAGGCCIYYGPWQSSVQYFASAGYVCPVYTNPTDFYLTISKDAASFLAKKWTASSKQWLIDDLTASGDAYGQSREPLPTCVLCSSLHTCRELATSRCTTVLISKVVTELPNFQRAAILSERSLPSGVSSHRRQVLHS